MTDKELYQQMLHFIECSGYRAESIKKELKIRLAQPKKEWVGLTKEEARKICVATVPYVVDMAAAIEAKLKEKNT
jgi:hypothetical protein